jgi:hypothetical protein
MPDLVLGYPSALQRFTNLTLTTCFVLPNGMTTRCLPLPWTTRHRQHARDVVYVLALRVVTAQRSAKPCQLAPNIEVYAAYALPHDFQWHVRNGFLWQRPPVAEREAHCADSITGVARI